MKDPRILLSYVLECADLVAVYIGAVSWEEFTDDTEKQDAVLRRLEVIGQAVKDLPKELRSRFEDVPWRKIAGMRDKLSHDYLGIDLEVTWNPATRDLPELRRRVAEILSDLGAGDLG
jgi:uncharacterized protein with HEPN domain